MPDIAGVFPDGAIAGKLAHARAIEDRHARPAGGISIDLPHLILAANIIRVIRLQHIRVTRIEEAAHDRLKHIRLLGSKVPVPDHVNHAPQLGIAVVILPGVIAASLYFLDLLFGEAKNEYVLLAHFLQYFYVRPVQRANGQGSVEGELHVPGARGLSAGGGDLLRKVGSGKIRSPSDTP